ncbi:MAG: HAMP domain-containing sensor histidine kinase [Verrucomicrobia bacterium]|nr:HAMP domain-containing sensor histidine kinase [Verrucomicrobiota bacterium]
MAASSTVEPKQTTPFVVLSVVALVPTVCVLWFMTIAMRNEQLAVHERLSGVYENHLVSVGREITAFWKNRQARLLATEGTPSEVFASLVRSGLADGVLVYGASNTVLYPTSMKSSPPDVATEGKDWTEARELEFQKSDYLGAAEAYGKIVEREENVHAQARALQSQAGCLLKAGKKDDALGLMSRLTESPEFKNTLSAQGSALVPNVQLLMLKLETNSNASVPRNSLEALKTRLNDYGDPILSSSQRRFLMEEILSLGNKQLIAGEIGSTEHATDAETFPTLEAERLAALCLESDGPIPAERDLRETSVPGVWTIASTNAARIALFREARVQSELANVLRSQALPGLTISLISPGNEPSTKSPLPTQPAGDLMPGWQLSLQFQGTDPFSSASKRQTRFYLSIGGLVVFVILAMALLAARYVGAQMRLARLKNDLVSTVSHELKTPLASMRALVDTLASGRYRSEEQLREYLELISKENLRLSHLIENFLTFSRMERGKQRFQFAVLPPESIVNEVVEALGDKFQPALPASIETGGTARANVRNGEEESMPSLSSSPESAGHAPEAVQCDFKVELDSGLPLVRADRDALTTVLINLTDNAFKYTENKKRIRLRVRANGDSVCFEVEDNGIGLSAKELKSVFDRFYQADQSLTRQRGGCGLGLSIVQTIVKAHNGVVEVESEPGRGSTFRVRIPIANEGEAHS